MKRLCFAATLLILLTLSGCGGKGAITITPPENSSQRHPGIRSGRPLRILCAAGHST